MSVNHNGKTFEALAIQQGEEWKSSRHALTPAFSARKMKLVSDAASRQLQLSVLIQFVVCVDGALDLGECEETVREAECCS